MSIPKQVQEVAWNRIGDQVVILSLHTDSRQFHELNSTASAIWLKIDGIKSPSEIARSISDEYDVDFNQAKLDTDYFLNDLLEKNLIQFHS